MPLKALIYLAFVSTTLFGVSCEDAAGEKSSQALPESSFAARLMSLSDEARIHLAVPVPESREAIRELTRLRQAAARRIGQAKGAPALAVLNRFLFEELGFVREVDDLDVRFMMLPWVLKHRKGSCLGLAGLYLLLARDLKLSIRGVLVPGHFFLRLKKKETAVNIELLRQGESMPDEWYKTKWPFENQPQAYMRSLSDQETVAVFHFNLGNAYREAGNLERAIQHYEKATSLFGTFAEAHASLGLCCQIRRDRPCAERAYLRARELQPGLPGLEQNLDVLSGEKL